MNVHNPTKNTPFKLSVRKSFKKKFYRNIVNKALKTLYKKKILLFVTINNYNIKIK